MRWIGRVGLGVACALGALPPLAAQDRSLRAAAELTGVTAGMASACGLDPKPVLHAFRDLMDRKQVQGTARRRLVRLVSTASDRGYATQREPGAMTCAEVKVELGQATRRLRKAR